MSNDVDDFLAHYGVPGMKWGKKKGSVSAPDKRIAKIDRQLNRLNGHRIYDGAGLTGWAVGKGKSNPGSYVKRTSALKGAVEVAAILGGVNIGLSKMRLSPRNKQGARVSALILAGTVAKVRIDEIRNVSQFQKQERLIDERSSLVKSQKGLS